MELKVFCSLAGCRAVPVICTSISANANCVFGENFIFTSVNRLRVIVDRSLHCLYSLTTSHNKMSRFFRQAGDSDSESEESEEELMSSGDEAPQVRPSAAPVVAKPLGMARFLRRGSGSSSSSDSDEDSDEDEDDSDEDEEKEKEKEVKKRNRFLLGAGGEEEDSDEEVKRVVKSAKDKRLEEIDATGKVIDNALKINDWVAINNGARL